MLNEITPAEFEAVEKTCTRWAPRSLEVVKALLLDKQPITKVANDYDMTAQQANVLRSRFIAKFADYQVSAFTSTVAPEGKPSPYPHLQKREAQLRALAHDGYTDAQIVKFLASQSIAATANDVRKFLKGTKL